MKTNELLKGNAEMIILSALKNGPKHGYAIQEWIQAESKGEIPFSPGTLYPLLHKLEKKKVISSMWVAGSGGPKRKEYTLTARGKKVLGQSQSQWRQFAALIQQLTS